MNNLKAVSTTANELRVGNYIVLFGGKDLVGEFFTPQTEFKSAYTDLGVMYVDFEHGRDPDKMGNDPNNVLGIVDWKTAKADSTGIYVERILNRRAGYMKFVEELLGAGVMGTSSLAIPGATARKASGEIVDWPLMRDSLTVTPMEPRMVGENVLAAAKSLHDIFPHAKSLAKLCGVDVSDDRASRKNIEDIETLADCERILRFTGFTKSDATLFVSRMKKLCRSDSGPGDRSDSGLADVLAALQSRAKNLPA